MKWQLQTTKIPKTLEDLKKILLENRGIKNPDSFLNARNPQDITLEDVAIDPGQVDLARKRIEQAVDKQEKVVIFGDYDADGITAASLLWLTLAEMGLKSQPFIPKRDEHGYGISSKALDDLVEKGKPDLIITVDNGIVAHEAIKQAVDQGIDVIVTDHHQPEKVLPPALAIIHSTQICGAAVAWFLARKLLPDFAISLLGLVGIATIADQMPLLEESRELTIAGIKQLRTTNRPGLKALFDVAGVDQSQINSFTVGFVIAPRINAVGRLVHGLTAMRLLCTNSLPAAKRIAQKMNQINQRRQDLTRELFNQALAQAKIQQDQKVLIITGDDYHEGIIGLIAGQLTEKYHKPTVVVSTAGDEAKGSARSIKGVNITQMLRGVQELLIDVGGHELAAGFSIRKDNLEQFKQALLDQADQTVDEELLQLRQKIECKLPLDLVNNDAVSLVDQLAPFGMGNFPPIFSLEGLELLDASSMGKGGKHLRLSLKNDDLEFIKAVGWNKAYFLPQLTKGSKIRIAAGIEFNHWNGKTSIQFKIKDIKTS